MRKFNAPKYGKKLKKGIQMLPSMGIAFIVLGVIILTISFVFSTNGNFLLFAGLFFILGGGVGYIYSLKKE